MEQEFSSFSMEKVYILCRLAARLFQLSLHSMELTAIKSLFTYGRNFRVPIQNRVRYKRDFVGMHK